MRELLTYSQGGGGDVVEEKLVLRIMADANGDIYLPIGGYSPDGTHDCEYEWYVSIDGKSAVEYKGIASYSIHTVRRVGYGLVPSSVHTVKITPINEGYGWLRAFGYKGTGIESSLINIISDKSYKGYAVSEINTGDYYKAYQYYGCNNLVSTDEELLPETLEVIGDYYRYYEYAGCSSLIKNADEKILKTVRVIGDNYRAYQYENCTGINRINMRAINWASVGENYRLNQYSGIASDRKPAEIYIEGGIEEGGNWGLSDDRVKGIYVYKDLVSDYRTKLSGITNTKIQKNAEWDGNEYEFIEYIGIADNSGEMRIPVGGYSTSFLQNCDYDWYVSIDGGVEEEISGTGSASYVSVGSGLTEGSEHRVVIKPKTIGWGWGRAFGFHTTGAQGYIKELIHDSYKCFATSRTSTGAHYKHGTFEGCTNLINSYEKLPTSVTTIGGYYMKECYAGCTGLKTAFWEVLHKGISVGVDYRYQEYTGCTSLEVHQGVAGYVGDTYPTNYKYQYLSGAGNDLKVYISRYEKLSSGLTNSMGLTDNVLDGVYCFVDDIYNYETSSDWSVTKYKAWYYNYVCYEFKDIDKYTKLVKSVNITESGIENAYTLMWGIAVERRVRFGRIAIAAARWGVYDNGGSGSQAQAKIYEYKLSTAGDLSKTPTNPSSVLQSQQSRWSGSNKTFVGGHRYSRRGTSNPYFIWNNARNGENYDYYSTYMTKGTLFNSQGGGDITKSSTAISDNGLFAWGVNGKYRLSSKDDPSGAVQVGGNGQQVGLTFSNDGMKMYSGYEVIKEYALPKPRDTDNKVDTGRTLSIGTGGSFDISVDGKYLFVYRAGTIYQYTYE